MIFSRGLQWGTCSGGFLWSLDCEVGLLVSFYFAMILCGRDWALTARSPDSHSQVLRLEVGSTTPAVFALSVAPPYKWPSRLMYCSVGKNIRVLIQECPWLERKPNAQVCTAPAEGAWFWFREPPQVSQEAEKSWHHRDKTSELKVGQRDGSAAEGCLLPNQSSIPVTLSPEELMPLSDLCRQAGTYTVPRNTWRKNTHTHFLKRINPF